MIVASPRAARAEGNEGYGILIGMLGTLGTIVGTIPVVGSSEDGAPLSLDFDLGAGGELDELSFGTAGGGIMKPGGWFGWTTAMRFNTELDGSRRFKGSMRLDTFANLRLLGDEHTLLKLDALVGGSLWLTVSDDRALAARAGEPYTGEAMLFGAGAPLFGGLRSDLDTTYFHARLEASYVPFVGDTPTGHTHHLEVLSQVGVSPWPDAVAVPELTLTLRNQMGVGEGDVYLGTAILGGASLHFGGGR